MLDLGGYYSFKPGFQLLFSAGHTVVGQAETYTYLALYWTWGPKGEENDRKDAASNRAPVAMLNLPGN